MPCIWRRGIPDAESEAGNAAASGASGLHALTNRRRDAVAGRLSFQERTRFFGAATIAFAGRQCSGWPLQQFSVRNATTSFMRSKSGA